MSLLIQSVQFSSVQSLSHVWLFATPWIAACQTSLSITNSRSLPKLMSIKSVMPSNHLILCHPLLLLPSIFASIRVFSNKSVLLIGWPRYCSFSFSIGLSSEYSGLISFRMDWLDLYIQFSSVTQSCETLCNPYGLEHARPLCPLPTPSVYSNSCPLSRWCHPTICGDTPRPTSEKSQ